MPLISKQLLLIPILFLFLLFPNITIEGAGNGLFLWYNSVVPALLPFLMMTQLFLYSGSYVMAFSFFCGYPTAARLANQRLRAGIISSETAQFYLYLCNNAGIAFLIGYVCHGVLQNQLPTWKFLLGLYLPQLMFCGCYYFLILKGRKSVSLSLCNSQASPVSISMEQAMTEAFSIIMKIGGYIMLFSIVANFISYLPLSDMVKSLLLGILEITNGLQSLTSLSIDPVKKTALAAAFCSFGGLCSIAQTKSVITEPTLSIAKYILVKIVYSICTYIIVILIQP